MLVLWNNPEGKERRFSEAVTVGLSGIPSMPGGKTLV